MALETASTISQLNPANPSGADRVHQGDDHIRLIKAVLKATFPNITGPITRTQAQLNTDPTLPMGLIMAWYGDATSVPSGYAICDGRTVSRTDGQGNITLPDLRDRVILGAAGTYAPLATPGAPTSQVNTGSAGAHTHTTGAGGGHTHTATASSVSSSPSISTTNVGVENEQRQETVIKSVTLTGASAHTHQVAVSEAPTHTHTVNEAGAHTHSVQVSTLQPSMALHYIMKV